MVRAAMTVVAAAALVALAVAVAGNLGGAIAASLVVLVLAAVRLVFPRFAAAMFRAGRYDEARRYYRVIAALAWQRARRDAAAVSIAATRIGEGAHAAGLALLARLEPDRLAPPTRAGYLNARAYAELRRGAAGADATAALADVRAALALFADAPALLHTEGLALYACGEVDAAIAAWEAMWDRGELPSRLDAERCDDLAVAWERRGEPAYAAEYRRRAAMMVPDAPWRAAG